MKIGLYARVSTSDKDQDPETQLLPLREFIQAQGWESHMEYVDMVPATDLAHRTAWRQLLDDASRRKFDLLLVWRMDRAFRSVLDAATTLGDYPLTTRIFHATISSCRSTRSSNSMPNSPTMTPAWTSSRPLAGPTE